VSASDAAGARTGVAVVFELIAIIFVGPLVRCPAMWVLGCNQPIYILSAPALKSALIGLVGGVYGWRRGVV
jgi:hypothetical protein